MAGKLDPKTQALPQHAERLRQVFANLYTSNADGTIGRDLLSANDLKIHWPPNAQPIEPVVNKATDEAGLFEIQQLMIGGHTDVYVSLPQDSLARLGRKIDDERETYAFGRTRVVDTLWVMIPVAFLCAVISWYGTSWFRKSQFDEEIAERAKLRWMRRSPSPTRCNAPFITG